MTPDWKKCEDCELDGTASCKVVTERVNSVEHCRGPYPLKKRRRKKK